MAVSFVYRNIFLYYLSIIVISTYMSSRYLFIIIIIIKIQRTDTMGKGHVL